jgi:hypothetical protein
VVKAVISGTLLAATFYVLDWRVVLQQLREINVVVLSVAMVFVLATYLVMSVRWFLLVRIVVPLGFLFHLRCYLTANFMNVFTPANLGGDAYRLLALQPHASRSLEIVVALLRERLIGVIGFAVFYLACFLWVFGFERSSVADPSRNFSILAAMLVLGLVLVWGLGSLPLISRDLPSVRQSSRLAALFAQFVLAFRFGSARRFATLLALSILGALSWTMVPLLVASDLRVSVSFAMLGMICIFVELIRLVPISVQGIGVREGLFAYCFTLIHLPPEQGFLIGAVSYLMGSLGLMVTGVAGWLMPGTVVPAKRPPA